MRMIKNWDFCTLAHQLARLWCSLCVRSWWSGTNFVVTQDQLRILGLCWSVRAVIPSVVVSLTGCWQIIISFLWQKPIITVSLSPHTLKCMMSWQQQFCIFRFLGAHYLMIWLNQRKKKKKACSQELQIWSGNYVYCVTRLVFQNWSQDSFL